MPDPAEPVASEVESADDVALSLVGCVVIAIAAVLAARAMLFVFVR